MANSWGSGFQGTVTVTAGEALTSWTTSFTLPGTVRIQNAWSAEVSGSGAEVTARNAPWNGSVAAGASTTFGFVATGGAPTSAIPVTCTAG